MDTRKVIGSILSGLDGLYKLEKGLASLLQADGSLNVFCQVDSPFIYALQGILGVDPDSRDGDIVAEVSIGCGKGMEERIDMLMKIKEETREGHGTDAG